MDKIKKGLGRGLSSLIGEAKVDIVYILPSKSLFDYQERFKERVSGSFSFG